MTQEVVIIKEEVISINSQWVAEGMQLSNV